MQNRWTLAAGVGALLFTSSAVWAGGSPLALNQEEGSSETTTETTTETTIETTETTVSSGGNTVKGIRLGEKEVCFKLPCLETFDVEARGYLGVDDFFWVREANPNVRGGQWQIETKAAWTTWKSGLGHDDDLLFTPSIKYGITDDLNVELEVLPLNIGDGARIDGYRDSRDGMGDLNLKLFWRFLEEQDLIPAMALWTETRIPFGAHSEKIDATAHLNLTKTIHEKIRVHATGYLTTANGARGDGDRDPGERGGRRNRWVYRGWGFNNGDLDDYWIGDRRHVQWGLGMGFDYSIDEKNLLVMNYLNKSSDYYGNANTNIIGAGWVHHLTDNQQLLVGVDYADTRGTFEGPRWTTKAQWSISF